jgi:SAM-dependent methyltransferase
VAGDDDVLRSGAYWDARHLAPPEDVRYWLAVPEIRRAVNRRLTGDPERLYITSFVEGLAAPVGRVLSVGCGTGELERGVAGHGAARAIDGIDVGAASLREAARLAAEQGFGDRIAYHQADAAGWLRARGAGSYDLIFFHGSLHHVEALEEVLALAARALEGGSPGLLYVDEYIGPSRDEWTAEDLAHAAAFFARVPAAHRRTPAVWPPIAIEDPTEMIRSSAIEAALRERFEVLDYRPYYGNVLLPLVAALKGGSLEHPEVAPVLRAAIALEADLADRGLLRPLYAVFVAAPAPRGEAGAGARSATC